MPPNEFTPTGRLKRRIVSDRDKWILLGMHLWWVLLVLQPIGLLAVALPIGLWAWKKNEDEFLDDQGRESVNFLLSVIIICFALAITIVGLLLIVPYLIVCVVSAIRAASASTTGEYFRYPMTFRML
ncbi:MAG TPA: DUF4870 domain-containing protein [Phycisphaerales bacterium]|nr:DUF4870 domain-containing protein [Phycisphaerales bacterium]HMP37590.1 DUF4870 domain-containing protein [Phycisphaerales bacterium]